jgi:DNA-binding protein HU-beta
MELGTIAQGAPSDDLLQVAFIKTAGMSLRRDGYWKNGKVMLVGFGTFNVAKRKARTGRNPQTGEELKITARNVPRFLPGKKLRDTVG